MFADADVKTNLDAMKNDKVRTVNDMQDDKIDVAVESVKVFIVEENNVMMWSKDKFAKDDATDAKDDEIGEE